ncbi:hypothetical protein BFP72_07250 [Reichenbachiella sp. 5M10]|uniref:tetratricopeptide repeat protein n=1 Tax=Reichenbachiella sp. 5M10 TaxID=1889772 RepID=UPI000C14FD31|nr:tetratricopeptide repeat protein [Reichenbachiella sp. 5M10]PIB35205.1 hypothetical protein BFP72_07250 [Reichenbachiella sp. 5M10]
MKFTIISTLLLGLTHLTFGQDVIHTISDEVCVCLTKEVNKGNTDMTAILTKCMENGLGDHSKKLEKKYGKNSLEEKGNIIGMDIAKVLAKECGAFIDMVIANEQNKDKNASELVRQAESAKEQGNYDEAIVYYGQAIALDPDDPEEILNDRGITYYTLGQYYRAISDFYRAMEIEPENQVYYYNIAYALYNLEDYSESIKYLDLTLDRKSNYCKAYNLKGLIYDSQGNNDSSLVYFQKAYACDNSDKVKAYNIGYSYYQLYQYDSALMWLKKSESMGYEDEDLYNYIGNSYYGKEDYETALPYHQKHLAYDSGNFIAYYNMGTCYYWMGQYDLAIEHLEKAYKKQPNDSDITNYLALCYKKKNHPSEALAFASLSIENESARADYYDLRAEILVSQGDYDKAILDYATSIRLYPSDCSVYQLMGETYTKLKELDKAKAAFNTYSELECE